MTECASPLHADPQSLLHTLCNFKPSRNLNRFSRDKRLNVLHLLSQQPVRTGSGVALLAMVHFGAQAGYRQRAVIGLPGDAPLSEIPPLIPEELVEALNRQLDRSVECGRVSGADCRLTPMSWAGVFSRVKTAYRELAEDPY